MKKLNITFCSFPDYAGNAKALYQYMVKRYKDRMNYTFVVYNEESVAILKEEGVKAVLIGSDEFNDYIKTTDVFFTTQGNLDGDKVKAKNAIYIELWHGIGPKPSGFCQKNPSKEDIIGYDNISDVVDYFMVPSEFWAVIFGAMFKVEYERIKCLGMPILDYFDNAKGKDNLSKVLDMDLSKYKKIIAYMPTFRKGFNHSDINTDSGNVFNIKKGYSNKKLNKFLKDNNYLLCIKLHPGELANSPVEVDTNIKLIEEEKMIKNKISINEFLNAIDLLITDYSSLGTEFIYFNRPVLFNFCDILEYKKNRGLYFDSEEFWFPGPSFQTMDELLGEMSKLLTDQSYYEKERSEKRRLWFGELKSSGCDAICDFLFDGDKISKNVKRHSVKRLELKKQLKDLENMVEEQEDTIKRLTESDIRLKEIEASRAWKSLEKLRQIKRNTFKR